MWLPKDERRLLAGYYKLIGEVKESKGYHEGNLVHLLDRRPDLARVHEYGRPGGSADSEDEYSDIEAFKSAIKRQGALQSRVSKANAALVAREMIALGEHQHEQSVVFVGLTITGYDLGRRYTSFWNGSGLWFEEYRNHWVWWIMSFLGGFAAALLLDVIKRVF